jgi:hypothetical protein
MYRTLAGVVEYMPPATKNSVKFLDVGNKD